MFGRTRPKYQSASGHVFQQCNERANRVSNGSPLALLNIDRVRSIVIAYNDHGRDAHDYGKSQRSAKSPRNILLGFDHWDFVGH